jgi:hypothetical protein
MEEAYETYNKAISLEPSNEDYQQNLKKIVEDKLKNLHFNKINKKEMSNIDTEILNRICILIDNSAYVVSKFNERPLAERLFGTKLNEEMTSILSTKSELLELQEKYRDNVNISGQRVRIEKIINSIENKKQLYEDEKNLHFNKGK